MSVTGDLFMGPDSQECREPRDRLKAYLGGKYRDGYATKRLSRALRCTPKTAENILNGHWPNSQIWGRIAALFGQDVLDAVFGPDINATVARLKREECELEQLLAEKRARRLLAEGPGPRDHERSAASSAEVVPLEQARSFAPRGRR